jgi:hypothetical protein
MEDESTIITCPTKSGTNVAFAQATHFVQQKRRFVEVEVDRKGLVLIQSDDESNEIMLDPITQTVTVAAIKVGNAWLIGTSFKRAGNERNKREGRVQAYQRALDHKNHREHGGIHVAHLTIPKLSSKDNVIYAELYDTAVERLRVQIEQRQGVRDKYEGSEFALMPKG